MKKTMKKQILKTLSQIAYAEASKSANTSCPFFSYQPKLPNDVKKLRKF